MGHIRRLTSKEIEAILTRYGFVLVGQRGSHRKWRNSFLNTQGGRYPLVRSGKSCCPLASQHRNGDLTDQLDFKKACALWRRRTCPATQASGTR